MSFRKLWYVVTLVAFAILPLTGCSSNGNSVQTTPKGIQLTVDGNVDASKASSKSVGLAAGDANSVTVYNAQDGSVLGTTAVDGSGKFSGLTFTLTSAKTVLVFKATVAQGVFRSIVPLDLSNPPAAGITASNSINISISQDTNNIAVAVSQRLGLAGILGDAGMTLAAVSKTFADVVSLVLENGGQVLAYNTNGLALSGSIGSAVLLPAKDASTFTFDDLNNVKPDVKIISAFIPGKNPIVNFQVTDKANGKGISGLRTFGLHIAKLIPEDAATGASSYWVNYLDRGISLPAPLAFATTANKAQVTGTIGKPVADPAKTLVASSAVGIDFTKNPVGSVLIPGYTVIDHGDGNYTAIFYSDVTSNPNAPFDPAKIHRVGVTVTTIAVPGVTATGPINPATGTASATFLNINRAAEVYDFTPANGLPLLDANNKPVFARDIVTKDACDTCHYNNLPNMSGHFARWNPRLCVICHTATNTSGEGEFVTLIHRAHMGKKLPVAIQAESVLNPTKLAPRTNPLLGYATMAIPQDIRNCTVCHKGADVDAWKTQANRKNCGSCHNGLDFATGANLRIVTPPTATTAAVYAPAHMPGPQANDQSCAGCHVTEPGAISPVAAKHALPAAADAAKRTLNATFKSAAVDSATGKLTVNFTVDDNGVAVTDPAKLGTSSFILAKLMPAANGASNYWQSNLVQFRTKDGTKKPVLQGTSEAATAANPVSYDATKLAFTFTFALPYAKTPGDIRDGFTQAPIKRSLAPYANDTMLDLPFPITYDAAATYRVGLLFTNNKANATFDFVPNGVAKKQTRAIVAMASCQKCHAGSKLHQGYNIEICVACHSLNSFDPFSGDPNGGVATSGTGGNNLASVDLQTIIHKIHMGARLPSNAAGGTYTINGEAFNTAVYPANIKNCTTCHIGTTYTNPTKAGCVSCHDGVSSNIHVEDSISNGVQSCQACHATNRKADATSSHRWW